MCARWKDDLYYSHMLYLLNGGGRELGFLTSPITLRWLQKIDARRILVVPFAEPDQKKAALWRQVQANFSHTGFEMRVAIYDEGDTADLEAGIFWCDMVYFPAGSVKELIDRLVKSGMVKWIAEAQRNGNILAIGGGAEGAMAIGQYCLYAPSGTEQARAGCNFISRYLIDCHFTQQQRLDRLKSELLMYPGAVGLGIDDHAAVVLDEKGVIQQVYGSGTVTLIENGSVRVLQPRNT